MVKITLKSKIEKLFAETETGEFFEYGGKIYIALSDITPDAYNFTDNTIEDLSGTAMIHPLDVELICKYTDSRGAN